MSNIVNKLKENKFQFSLHYCRFFQATLWAVSNLKLYVIGLAMWLLVDFEKRNAIAAILATPRVFPLLSFLLICFPVKNFHALGEGDPVCEQRHQQMRRARCPLSSGVLHSVSPALFLPHCSCFGKL